jgi:hypothetical protein
MAHPHPIPRKIITLTGKNRHIFLQQAPKNFLCASGWGKSRGKKICIIGVPKLQ